jgi:hypothetical protein
MTEAAAIKELAAINREMLDALLVIHRIAHRAMSNEERVGQRIQRDPRGEINGLLVQMAAIERLARAGLRKEGRELLDFARIAAGPNIPQAAQQVRWAVTLDTLKNKRRRISALERFADSRWASREVRKSVTNESRRITRPPHEPRG